MKNWILYGWICLSCSLGFSQESQKPNQPPRDLLTVSLPAGPGSLNNPLKGWCQYPDVKASWQEASMVFHYAAWKDLEPQEGQYAFDQWEANHWNQAHLSNKHVVLRVFVDYPSRASGLPDWLRDQGVTLRSYDDYGGGESPDYDHPKMREAMKAFIAAFGKRYNQDPRVAFIQLGLLGHWGEWHTFPRNELFASLETQQLVIDAFHESFPDKQLMARTADHYAGTLPWIGFHDDLFPQDTDNGHAWSFLAKIRKADRADNWQVAGIGGELVPGQARKWFGDDFTQTMTMAERAHFSWVGPYCPLQEVEPTDQFIANCETLVRRMGYDFRLDFFRHPQSVPAGEPLKVTIRGVNQGVAPFYYPWQVRFALLDDAGKVIDTCDVSWDIRKWLPETTFLNRAELYFPQATPAKYRLAIGIIDPWLGTPRMQFANQLDSVGGWNVLSTIEVLSR